MIRTASFNIFVPDDMEDELRNILAQDKDMFDGMDETEAQLRVADELGIDPIHVEVQSNWDLEPF